MQTSSIRLLQLVPEPLPTFRADVAALFGHYLPELGVQCDLLGKPGGVASADATAFSSVRTSSAHGGRLRKELSYLWRSITALVSADRKKCDVIQVRDMVSIGLLGLIVARWKRIPFVYWVSFLMCEARIARASTQLALHGGLRNRLVLLKGKIEERILYGIVLRYSQHVFVQSDAMLDVMVQKGIAAERLSAVPMGVDTRSLASMPVLGERPPGWGEGPLIAYLGTLDASRQIDRMIDALAIVRGTVADARLLLIGASALKADTDHLIARAREAGLADAVRITGWLPSRQAWTLLASADAAISYFPRGLIHDVCSPTKLMEYLALGMPVVANDNPDQAQVIGDSGAGWLVESTTEAMAEALLQILSDLPAARARAEAGPTYIRSRRSYSVIAEKVAQQYRVIARR